MLLVVTLGILFAGGLCGLWCPFLYGLIRRRKRPAHKTPALFAEYREPPDPRRNELEKRIALSWLALRNAERNGEWFRASILSRQAIPRLERELELLTVRKKVPSPPSKT